MPSVCSPCPLAAGGCQKATIGVPLLLLPKDWDGTGDWGKAEVVVVKGGLPAGRGAVR